ncbi:MAG: DUF5117 domain-containing protein [Gemmatimonadetes bacterium]|nr:MAG: DUF5117 domain-containing protein [Gemmatimonadota bacterium]
MFRGRFARSALLAAALSAATLSAGISPVLAQEAGPKAPPTIEEKTEGMQKIDGYVPVYFDARDGKIWLEIGRFDTEFLHYTSLPAGLGQNDIGLNRGDLGPRRVVVFRRVGPRVLMVQPNYDYRAVTDDPLERRSVEDGFPTAVLWGFTVAAETEGRVLVDATPFFLRDWHGVIQTLRRANQGTWRFDDSRSAIHMPRTRGFPKNTEVELTLTFTSDNPGRLANSVAATPGVLTVRQHHSFVELPELGTYEPRRADPRAGFFGVSYMDFATPIGEPLTKRYIARHRLEKRDPSAAVSEPVEPIVYYLDPGTPEPVRSALLEGGNWWNQAFEAAGYRNAFRVEMLPDTADPMDLRYNVIQWVHRSTRGWSYGNSVTDPRTGEILKGHVTLGSLRVRQDYLIAEGLLSPYGEDGSVPDDMREMALARIRQLSAHEIGHTLGLAHNYIASAQRAAGVQSVMDYPHPRVRLAADGSVDVSDAYETEIGAWDKVAIAYGYQDFPDGTDVDAALDSILRDARERGITFISDQDARPSGSAHPNVHLWDNGPDAAAELERMMDVRRVALDRFGASAVRMGRPLATIEEALVPLYLHHRYQAEAAAKVVGGLYYTYALRGDGQEPLRFVPAEEQGRALDALLRTLRPDELALPEAVLSVIPPRPYGYGLGPELFRRHTGLVFDALAPAEAASDLTVGMLLDPQRAARLVEQEARDPSLPGLDEVLRRLVEATFDARPEDGYEAEIARTVQRVVAQRIMGLAERASMAQVRALATRQLVLLRDRLSADPGDGAEEQAHRMLLAMDIGRFLERPYQPAPAPSTLPAPPGSPIGGGGDAGTMGGGSTDAAWFGGPVPAADPLSMALASGAPDLRCSWWW